MSNIIETKTIRVDAFWNAKAQVWVATSEDLAGLVTEASSYESLVEKLRIMIPELLELNESSDIVGSQSIDLDLRSRRSERISIPAKNGRAVLLQQVGALADDDTLAQLRATIYHNRQRSEVDTEPVD